MFMRAQNRFFLKKSNYNEKNGWVTFNWWGVSFVFNTEKTTLASAAKIKKLIDSGLDPYDAYNVAQYQMIDVAQAHLERIVLRKQFLKSFKPSKAKIARKSWCDYIKLYALSQIEKQKDGI
jgi:hypothetical protein